MPDGSNPGLAPDLDAALREAERRRVDLVQRVAELHASLSHTVSLARPALRAPAAALDAGRAAVGAVRARPVTTALAVGAVATAIGLAIWASRRWRNSQEMPASALAGTEAEAVGRWADDGGPVTEDAAALLDE